MSRYIVTEPDGREHVCEGHVALMAKLAEIRKLPGKPTWWREHTSYRADLGNPDVSLWLPRQDRRAYNRRRLGR